MKTVTKKAAELIFDFDLYPRNNVDSQNVRYIMDAMKTGIEMPPVVICAKSKRIIDGFHRVKAAIRLNGDDAKIQVIEKTYANEADLFVDAMRYNAAHGSRLDSCDRTRCILISEKLNIPKESIAGALNMSLDKLAALRDTRTAKYGNLNIPIKRTIRHMAGRRLNNRQLEANEHLSGMNQTFYANQLIHLLESDMLEKDDEKLCERLRLLHDLLDKLLGI